MVIPVSANRRSPSSHVDEHGVFLNVPYDQGFEPLYIAYVSGLIAFGLEPRATLQIPGGERRLDRILELIGDCRYSFHDLSRVELNLRRPATPRFNMPFELGLAVAWQRFREPTHTWCVFESRSWRAGKSLSDLSGTDVYIHGGNAGWGLPRVRECARSLRPPADCRTNGGDISCTAPRLARYHAEQWRKIAIRSSRLRGSNRAWQSSSRPGPTDSVTLLLQRHLPRKAPTGVHEITGGAAFPE